MLCLLLLMNLKSEGNIIMILSIVMMVRNEEKFLEKTLNALIPLMSKIDSELIILDTGSTDRTIEIAKKFTSNVYFTKWNNNFADMRNVSISYAKGEWILVLDADEVLINYSKIIEFFDEELNESYNAATVSIKNIFYEAEDYDTSNTTSLTAVRMFKNNGILYEGKIHEQPRYNLPIYNGIAEFNHFGYLYEDDEFKKNKIQRNDTLLTEAVNKEPNNPYLNYQMGKNLMIENKIKESLLYLEKSYKLYKQIGIIPAYVYSTLSTLYIQNGMYRKCESLCNEYIKKDINNIDIYYNLGNVQKALGKIKESIKSFERYVFLVDNYEISSQANDMHAEGNCMFARDNVINTVMYMYYVLEEYSKVIELYSQIKSNNVKRGSRRIVFIALEKINRSDEILSYYNELEDSNIERNYFYNDLEIFIRTLKDKDKSNIYKEFSKIDGSYGKLNLARLECGISVDECRSILKKEKNTLYSSLIILACSDNVDLFDIMYDFDVTWMNKYINYSIRLDGKFGIQLHKYLINVPNTKDIKRISFYKVLSEAILGSINLDKNKYKELFYLYTMYSYQYMQYLYKDIGEENLLQLIGNDTEKFIIKFRQLIENNTHNKLTYVEMLRDLIDEYPIYKKIVKLLIADLEAEIMESDEFKALKKDFSNNIENLINNGNIKEAKQLVEEYSIYFKDDIMILNIKGILSMLEGNFKKSGLIFKEAYSLNMKNEDTIFNIKYLEDMSVN